MEASGSASKPLVGFSWGQRLPVLLLVALLSPCSSQLTTYPDNCAQNPLAGQGHIPANSTVLDFPVETKVHSVSLLGVDESKYTADMFLFWQLAYDDDASVEAIQANYTDGSCGFYCNVRMSTALNSAGQPTCCDNVFIPQAQAINSRGFFVQEYSERYRVQGISDTRMTYFRSFQGKFQYAWDSGAFPFDRHYILVDIRTAFKPVLERGPDGVANGASFGLVDGFAQLGASRRRVTSNPSYYRPDVNSKALPAWEVLDIFMEVVEFERKFTKDAPRFVLRRDVFEREHDGAFIQPIPDGEWRPDLSARYGVRVYILIQRKTTGFWIMTSILPVALVTIFGFGVQSIPRQSLKARTELLSTLFLSLVLLQTVLYQFLPPVYFLCLPLLLVLVGYVYTLLLFLVIIVAHAQEQQWRHRQLKLQRRWASQLFGCWAERLQQGPGAQAALALSSARIVVPFQVAQPNFGSGKRSRDAGVQQQPPVSEAAKDVEWMKREKTRWYFRIPAIRVLVEWRKFTGRAESQEYCRWVANRIDEGARIVLLVSYVAVVVSLCLVTAGRRQSSADSLVFPPEK